MQLRRLSLQKMHYITCTFPSLHPTHTEKVGRKSLGFSWHTQTANQAAVGGRQGERSCVTSRVATRGGRRLFLEGQGGKIDNSYEGERKRRDGCTLQMTA